MESCNLAESQARIIPWLIIVCWDLAVKQVCWMHQDATETPPAADNNDMRRQGEVVKYPTLGKDHSLNIHYTTIYQFIYENKCITR